MATTPNNARPGVPVDISRLRGEQARPYLTRKQDVETRLQGASLIQQLLVDRGLVMLSYTGADIGTGIVTLGLADSGVVPGQYNTVVVDRYGRVTHAWVDPNSGGGGGGLSTVTDDDTVRAGNTVYAGPDGVTGAANFRPLVPADIPGLDASKITGGVFADVHIASAATWNAKLSSVTADTTARTANTVYAAPNGVLGAASFRALAAADIPGLDAGKIVSGTISDVRIASASTWNAKLSSVDADVTIRGANTVYAAPAGGGGAATFRLLTAADLPATLTQNTTGSAARLTTSRSLSITGDATWSVNFDGSANVTAALTLSNTGITAGSYGSSTQIPVLTLDAKGRVTGVSSASVTVSSVAWSAVTGKPTTLAGYGITLSASDTPNLDASKITTGTFADARIASAATWNAKISTVTGDSTSRAANTVYAAPNGAAGTAAFRALVSTDIPELDTSKIGTGVMGAPRLGTGTADSTTWLRGDNTWVNPIVVSTSEPTILPQPGQTQWFVVEA